MKMRRQKAPGVAEVQGLYGPLQVLEGKVQQVWALQGLARGSWRTRRGLDLRVRHPGRWNRGAGPDFEEAVLVIGGEERIGDIELHLYREDWWRHGHQLDPAYDRVVLHVVLFAGGMEREVRTRSGRVPEEWVMGPWMREDVESVVGGDPGLFGELVPELREWMEADPAETVRERLRSGADRRWEDKVSMARCLLVETGWREGLHRMALFYLGFPFNRRPFYAMAEGIPPEDWSREGLLEEIREKWGDEVRWGVGRPASRAARRLGEYQRLNRNQPDWSRLLADPPADLVECLRTPLPHGLDTTLLRRVWQESGWRQWLRQSVLGGQWSASLCDRLWVDVFLPALGGLESGDSVDWAGLWFHAHPGPFPAAYREMLALAGAGRSSPLVRCNGWVQGLFWAEDQLRRERIRHSMGGSRQVP